MSPPCWTSLLPPFPSHPTRLSSLGHGANTQCLPILHLVVYIWGFQVALEVWPLGEEEPLEEGMVTHSNILAWRIPWTEEPGGLEPLGSLWVRLDGSDLAHTHARSVYRFQCYSFNSSHLLFPPAVSTRFFSMSVSLLPVCTFKFNFIWLPCVLDGAWGIFDLRCRMWATRELF